MRLHRAKPPAPQIPVIALANLALLVGTCVVVAAMLSASRGPALRFASADRDGTLPEEGAVRVEVSSEREARLDGTPVPFDRFAVELGGRLAGRKDPTVILVVSPEATYDTMLAALGAIEQLPGPPHIALPPVVSGR